MTPSNGEPSGGQDLDAVVKALADTVSALQRAANDTEAAAKQMLAAGDRQADGPHGGDTTDEQAGDKPEPKPDAQAAPPKQHQPDTPQLDLERRAAWLRVLTEEVRDVLGRLQSAGTWGPE